ncbi:MAG: TonB-dependent receptor [Paludibacter sp.]|nr:TonB-dependent receptor [Paludibacter sp.]
MKEAKFQKKLFFNRWMLAILVAVFAFSTVSAQVKTVTGVVKDASGETIIGASVIVKGTKAATITDIDGKFSLNVPSEGKVLVVSYIGMETQEQQIKGSVINVTLKATDKSLDEVVVIGYGTQMKKDLTGSVSSVSEKQLRDIPVASAAEAITGKLPGVQVTTTDGSPDAEIKIRVRGGGSITQSSTPLYIVDGFTKDDIKDIAPSEIQSIDVLKDASSTAIYGSRGANGVIIVTTKTAQAGKLSVSYNGFVGVSEVPKLLDVLSPYQFAQKQYERAVWDGKVASEYENYFGSYNDINLYKYTNGTNWQNKTFGNTGVTQNHTVTLGGGDTKFKYNATYNHINNKAVMYMSNYKRDNVSLKLNYTPLKWLIIDVQGRYAGTTINGSGANDQTGTEKSTSDSRVKSAVVYTPIPLKNLVSQSDDADATSSLYSPLVTTADNNRYQQTNDFNGNAGITINFLRDWSFHSTVGLTDVTNNNKRFYGLTSYYVLQGGAMKLNNTQAPATLITNTNTSTLQNTNLLTYKKDNFFPGQNINVVLGEENYINSSDYIFQDVEAFPVTYMSADVWSNLGAGTTVANKHFYNPDYRKFSYFGRINYDIKDRYLIAASVRADGSSRFQKNPWGIFPSISAGWRISEEPFMKDAQEWLSNLKLRVGYGEAGNDNIPSSMFVRNYSSSYSPYIPTSMTSTIFSDGTVMANPDLKWETTVTRNGGLDFGFFNNRLNGSIEVYSNTTYNALLNMSISGPYSSIWENVASTSNIGAELTLNAALVQTKDFNLNFAFNISTNNNKVLKLGNLTSYTFNEAWTSYTSASNSYVVTPGQPVGLIYGYVSDGMYSASDFTWTGSKWVMNASKYSNYNATSKTYSDSKGNVFVDNSSLDGVSWGPGAMKLKDIDGDGVITLNDKKVIGNTNPKHFGGFSFTGNYKAFDASVNFNWVYGNNIYNANKIELTSEYYKYRNTLSSTANSYTQIDWTTGNRITDANTLTAMNANATMWASPTGQYATTSWSIEDGSFLRLNNLTVGYTLPKRLTTKFYIQKLRVYASGYNLFILTKYTGYDPEVDTRRSTPATPGVDYSAYPKSRSYNVGLNVTF